MWFVCQDLRNVCRQKVVKSTKECHYHFPAQLEQMVLINRQCSFIEGYNLVPRVLVTLVQRWSGQQGPLGGSDPPDLRSKTGSPRILAFVSWNHSRPQTFAFLTTQAQKRRALGSRLSWNLGSNTCAVEPEVLESCHGGSLPNEDSGNEFERDKIM